MVVAPSPCCEPGLTCDLGATDETCVQPGAIGATCTDLLQCASANCAIPSGATSGLCAAATDPQCFDASGCDAAGGGRPGVGTALLLAAFVLTAMWRVRGPRRF
jgi:hypothetical protein